jgi:hypothetical protein
MEARHPQTIPLAPRVAAFCDAYDSTGDRAFLRQAVRILHAEAYPPARYAIREPDEGLRDPAAMRGDRARRFYNLYAADGAHQAVDVRDAAAAARIRRERLAVDAIAAFCAPLVVDSQGRSL